MFFYHPMWLRIIWQNECIDGRRNTPRTGKWYFVKIKPAVVVHGQELTAGTCKRQPFGTGRNQAFEGTLIERTFKQTTDNPSFLLPNWQMSWPQRKTTGERVYREQETERPCIEQGLFTIMLFRSTTLNHLPRKPQWPQVPNKQPSQVSINKFWYFQPTDGQQANKGPTTVRLYLTRR